MEVIIEEVISRIRTTSSEAALSPNTLRAVVSAVMEAIEADNRRKADRAEELSTKNYQQRSHPGR
jgi:hypothetical protein